MSTPAQDWKNDEANYNATHARRFELSRQALKPLLKHGERVLECGAPGKFSADLAREFQVTVENTTGDLRYNLSLRKPANHFDAVLCMEVFEHLHDQEADTPTEWRATGTDNLLRETFRVLKPGGFLFLTTPNACSFNVLEKVLTMQPPMMYRPHVREYSPGEIDQALKAHGFRIESFTTHDCWGGGCSGVRRREFEALLARASCQSPHRGECIFVIARKP